MANYHDEPLILLVPGFPEGASGDWMKPWENQRPDCQRLDLGTWDKPHRNTWVNKLNLAIHRAERPVILVAHDIGCLAAVWWAEYERPDFGDPVIGALLVAPPDVDRPRSDTRHARYGASPRAAQPIPAFVVADRRAPQSRLVTTTQLASDWDSLFTLDEIDADGWESGQYLLTRLLREHRPAVRLPALERVERQPVRNLLHA
jgi:predicted alpha/beta hydrolase family esterase